MDETTKNKQEALDKRYIRMASIWAENSYCKRRQVGALIVKDKMIISDGYNGNLTSKQNGSVGGYMVKKMIEAQEKQMSQGSGYTGGSMQ